ncbi:hypothetical protein [Rhodoglobus aureus]|uniref:Uncharacterized protein n=1 Tax=Rhodoglobus aureus TaxID=191497 RepID=A0ABN1VM38_9MICO
MLARHIDNASPSRLRRRWSVAAAATLFAIVTFVPTVGAAASVGSIPPDVTEFAQADDGLILELEEYFGVDQRGGGLDFSDGIEMGEIDRIFLWSDAFRSGEATETPVQYVNRWKIPVLIGEEPVGIAMIGIDPATVEPEMIDFIRGPGATLALDNIDEDATLVHEPETHAWFSLSDGVIAPLVRGESGIAGETTLAEYQPQLSGRVITVVEPSPQPDRGSVQSVVIIATTAVVLLLALLIPTIIGQVRERRERLAEAAGGAATEGSAEAEAEGNANVATVTNLTAESTKPDSNPTSDADTVQDAPAVGSATAATAKNSAEKTVTTSTTKAAKKAPATKPAARKSTTAAASSTTTAKKPAATKKAPVKKAPAAKKPAASKPAAKKPAAKKPAAKKPVVPKPTAKKPAAKKPVPAKSAAPESPNATESSAD